MKNYLPILPLLALALSAAAKNPAPRPSVRLRTTADSLAYYAGANLGEYVHSIDSTLDLNVIVSGLKDAMARNEAADEATSFEFLREYMLVRLPAIRLAESEAFLAQIERQPGVQKTESGLLYRIDRAGNMSRKAKDDIDQVRVVYHGTLPDGKVFDSSRERGDTTQFALNQVIRGWTEALKLIGEGGKITFWVHPELAYGEQGTSGAGIGPNQALVFEVELFEVIAGKREVEQQDKQEMYYEEEDNS